MILADPSFNILQVIVTFSIFRIDIGPVLQK